MATIKISELPAILGANTAATDVLPIVDTSLSTTNKITREEFFKNVPALEVAGDVTIADKIIHSGDTNTSIRFPAADTVTVETSGAERLRVNSSGNVGIGETTIVSKLDVKNGARSGFEFYPEVAADTDRIVTYDRTSAAYNNIQTLAATHAWHVGSVEKMRLDASGNVGIGTASPASIVGGTDTSPVLSIGGTDSTLTTGDKAGSLSFITNDSSYTATYADGVTGEIASIAQTSTGAAYGLAFYTGTVTGSNRAERVRITAEGNVGIGTSSPAGLLEVFDVLTVPARNTTTIASKRGLSIYNNQSSGQVDTTLVYGNTANSYLAIGNHNGTSYAERMRIDSSGNVLVGLTTAATGATTGSLSVRSNGISMFVGGGVIARESQSGFTFSGTDILPFSNGALSDNGVDLGASSYRWRDLNLAGALRSDVFTVTNIAGTERMRIDSSGNVGIGTTTITPLGSGVTTATISGASGGGIQFARTDATAVTGLVAALSGSFAVGSTTSTPVVFRTNNTERARIDSSGNVGIGTTSPSTRLHVSGDTTLGGAVVETVFALSGTTPAINPSNGTVQTWTLSGNSSPTDSLTAGESVTLMIDDGTAFTITWPSVTWVNNGKVAPTLATTGYTVVALWKVSTTLYGALVGDGT